MRPAVQYRMCLRKMGGAAIGRFRHVEGQPEESRIKLQADVFIGPVITTGSGKDG